MRILNGAAAALLVGLLFGCDKGTAPRTEPPSAKSASAAASTPASLQAVSAAPTTATTARAVPSQDEGVAVSPSAKTVDTSDWNGASGTLELRWTVDFTKAKPPIVFKGGQMNGDPSKSEVPIDLVMTMNGRSHSVTLASYGGSPSSFDSCSGVSFYWADLTQDVDVLRARGGKAVIVKSTDGKKDEQVYVFDLPANVNVVQDVVFIEPDKRDTKPTCRAPSLPVQSNYRRKLANAVSKAAPSQPAAKSSAIVPVDDPKCGCSREGVTYDQKGNVWACEGGGNWCKSAPKLAGGCPKRAGCN